MGNPDRPPPRVCSGRQSLIHVNNLGVFHGPSQTVSGATEANQGVIAGRYLRLQEIEDHGPVFLAGNRPLHLGDQWILYETCRVHKRLRSVFRHVDERTFRALCLYDQYPPVSRCGIEWFGATTKKRVPFPIGGPEGRTDA